jgi:hypothetical protein
MISKPALERLFQVALRQRVKHYAPSIALKELLLDAEYALN